VAGPLAWGKRPNTPSPHLFFFTDHSSHSHKIPFVLRSINDGLGGGSNFTTSLLFNTCEFKFTLLRILSCVQKKEKREKPALPHIPPSPPSSRNTYILANFLGRESGDHGALNSWDRMPFLTNIAGNGPSYSPALTETSKIFGIANYGSSQAFDNDDGRCVCVCARARACVCFLNLKPHIRIAS